MHYCGDRLNLKWSERLYICPANVTCQSTIYVTCTNYIPEKVSKRIRKVLRATAYPVVGYCPMNSGQACSVQHICAVLRKTCILSVLQGVSCPFFHKVQAKLGSQAQLRQLGLDTAWDIEDLIRVGNRVRVCMCACCASMKAA